MEHLVNAAIIDFNTAMDQHKADCKVCWNWQATQEVCPKGSNLLAELESAIKAES